MALITIALYFLPLLSQFQAGDYQISVKWSGKHVPNSPFNVRIFKTNEDLDKYLALNPQEASLLKDKQLAYQELNIV